MPCHPPILSTRYQTRRLSGTTAAPIWKKTRGLCPEAGASPAVRAGAGAQDYWHRTPLRSRFQSCRLRAAHTPQKKATCSSTQVAPVGMVTPWRCTSPACSPRAASRRRGQEVSGDGCVVQLCRFSARRGRQHQPTVHWQPAGVPYAEQPVGRSQTTSGKLTMPNSRRRTVEKNPVAAHIHTDATARDMDLMRHLLGDEKAALLRHFRTAHGWGSGTCWPVSLSALGPWCWTT